jgi:hypothetical protein
VTSSLLASIVFSLSKHHSLAGAVLLATGLIYQVTRNLSVDVNSFFGLIDSAPDYNVFVGFGCRF